MTTQQTVDEAMVKRLVEKLGNEAAVINRIRVDLGKWLQHMEDTNWDVNGSGGPDELTLSDLNDTVVTLRAIRNALLAALPGKTEVDRG